MTCGVIALFGPTGVGKTDVALALARARCATRGEDPVAVSADALQVYAGLELLTGVATPAQQRELEHRLVSFVPVDARFSVAEYAALAHAEIDELLAERRDADRGRRHRPLPARGADRARRCGRRRRPACASAGTRSSSAAARRRCTRCSRERAPWAAAAIDPADRHRIVRALELEEIGALEPPRGRVAAVERATCATRPGSSGS